MTVKVRFVADRAGIRAIGGSPHMAAEMRRRAHVVAQRAQDIAPVRTGLYRASIRVSSGVRRGLAYGRVTAGASYSGYVEFGTSKMRRQRVLGRALLSAGGSSYSVLRIGGYDAYRARRR